MENRKPARPTASNKPTNTSKGSAHADPDETASTERLLTVAEAGRWLHCSRGMINNLFQRRDLHKIYVGRRVRISQQDLQVYLASATVGAVDEVPAEPGPKPGPQVSEHELIQFLQSARGAPASVLLALGWAGRYLSHQELQVWTRCGHTQITLALRSLTHLGWVTARTPRGPWRLAADHAVPAVFTPADANALKALSSSDGVLRDGQSSMEEPLPSNARREQLLHTLRECRIWEPTASRLADLEHVTPEYIKAHVAHARAEGLRIGAAIRRIELGAPLPPDREEQADSRQEDIDEKIRRFIQG